jgi:phenylalanyl-tRNA synthetase beta chain
VKASYRWLRALVPDLDASPAELADRLTRAGLEVEALTEYGAGPTVVLARVQAIEPHPTRPKLRLVTVDRGGGQALRVVCGAPNVPDPGGIVALAPIGTVLPAVGMTLEARVVGGVASEGMLCSEIELGLSGASKSDPDPGILVLPADAGAPGTPLAEAMPATHDWILDIGVTPNRPDALGHVGIAREAAALFQVPFGPPGPDAPARAAPGAISQHVAVRVEDTQRCPHYGAAMVADVTVGPSPAWLRYRLESLGIRSISNVVDVTNLVLLEFGHPMHAFDLDLVRGKLIVARRAREGETLTTLDGVVRRLDPDDLVIADAEGPVALAGVMGGASSEIKETTRRVLLECAYFWPRGVRRSSRRHGLHTESSHRFERGVDYADVPDVLAHAASLLTTLAGGAGVPGTILAGVPFPERPGITLRQSRMDALLGVTIPLPEAATVLTRLGCTARAAHESVEIVPPTHRPDLEREVDLIEEVIRVRGLDEIPTVLPAIRPQAPRSSERTANEVRQAAITIGLSEVVSFGFVSPKELEALGAPPAVVTLMNPLTEERSVMRTTLLPGLLESLRRARRHGELDVRLFTVGARFLARAAGEEGASGADPDARLPDEIPSFAAVVGGTRHRPLSKPEEVDVYDAKGIAVAIAAGVTRREVTVAHQPPSRRAPYLHPRAAGDVLIDGRVVGAFGPLHPDVVDRLDLGGPCVIVELDLRALAAIGARTPRFRPIPALPAATRDLALLVHDDVSAGEVADVIRGAAMDLCESVELFDIFRGPTIQADHRSLAFHVVYRDPKAASDPDHARTLTDAEVDQRHQAVIEVVSKKLGATLRGGELAR